MTPKFTQQNRICSFGNITGKRILNSISFLLFAALYLGLPYHIQAQKVALIGINVDNFPGDDGFAFVALQALPAGEKIYFTDAPFDCMTQEFTVGDGLIQYTVGTGGLAIGDVITIVEDATTSNLLHTSCAGGVNCSDGDAVLINGPMSVTFTESLSAFSSSSAGTAIYADVDEFHSIIASSGSTEFVDPSTCGFPNALAVMLTVAIGNNGHFTPANRTACVTKADLENLANYSASQVMSTTRFTMISASCTGPEIYVTGNGLVIPDGNTAISCPDFTSFGYAESNSTSVSRMFVIGNSSMASALTLSGSPRVMLSGAGAAHFSVTQPASGTVPANSTLPFSIVYTPTATGAHTATVTIANDDADENPYNFNISGQSLAALPVPAVALVGFNTNDGLNPDGFSFVALRDLPMGYIVYFTDNEYLEATDAFNTGGGAESIYKYTSPGISKGDVVVVKEGMVMNSVVVTCSSGSTCSNSDVDMLGTPISLSNGDVLYAFHANTASTDPATIENAMDTIFSAIGIGSVVTPGCNHPCALTTILSADNSEYNPSLRAQSTDKLDLQNSSNFSSGLSSTVPFSNINLSGASGPDISVTGNGQVIPDGSMMAALYNYSHFGVVATDCGMQTRIFTITNNGDVALNLTGMPIVSISGAPEFVLSQPATGSLAPGASTDFMVSFSAIMDGSYSATISIASDDPDENPYDFIIEATASSTVSFAAIGLIGYSSSPDEFSFVALRDIVPGEVFYFTDDVYNLADTFQTSDGLESLYRYTSQGLMMGEVVRVSEDPGMANAILVSCSSGASCANGDVVLLAGSFSLTISDALYAFTTSTASMVPTTITSNIMDIHSVIVPFSNTDFVDPTSIHPNALVVHLPINDREYDPAGRNMTVEKVDLTNMANYIAPVTTLSVIPFSDVNGNPPDMTNPSITCPATQTRYLDASCNYTIEDFTSLAIASDDCGSPTVTQSPIAGGMISGENSSMVTLTATDGSGNTASCSFTLMVEDTTSPVAVCQNITVSLDGSNSATVTTGDINGGSTDNCGSPNLNASPTNFTCANIGSNNVTLTVTDGSMNSNSCIAMVTVVDTVSPTAVCQNITVYLDGSGNASITAGDVDGGSADNCGVSMLSADPTSFT
ncbi:MAG: choice-of-anchor D domain-containing protein, partial [Saprospiraceae bacterium]|nr:choice-of-anchor D domain-containing protein [Saprospiraceae bacterium]